MGYKNICIDIERDDVKEFIDNASALDLTYIIPWIAKRRKEINAKPTNDPWEVETPIICRAHTATQELACNQLQEYIQQHGVETIVDYLSKIAI